MKELNAELFAWLAEHVSEENRERVRSSDSGGWRAIKTTDEEKKRLKRLRLLPVVEVVSGYKGGTLTDGTTSFHFVPRGAESLSEDIPFRRHSVDAGFLTFLGGRRCLTLSSAYSGDGGLQLVEDIFGVGGLVDMEVVEPAVAEFDIFEPTEPLAVDQPDAVKASLFLCLSLVGLDSCYAPFQMLRFTDATRAELRKLLLLDSNGALGRSVFLGLSSAHWEHAFLRLYHCVEAFFVTNRVSRLVCCLNESHGAQLDLTVELEETVRNALSWRPSEANALQEVVARAFKKMPTAGTLIREALGVESKAEASTVAGKLYDVRNAIAHGRREEPADVEWDDLIRGLAIISSVLVGGG
ncbi:MAG: hypothetical protein ACE37F_00005 [Nannocystaceae bacterium]|nr:hypothetical protein [bacterium]